MFASGVRRAGVRGFVPISMLTALLCASLLICAGEAHAVIGAYEGKFGVAGYGAGEFFDPFDVAVAGNGDVYVADTMNNRIQYFSATGTYKGQWGTHGSGNGQFDTPMRIAIAPNGDVYVGDYANNRIQYFGPTGAYKGQWGSYGTGDGQLVDPFGGLAVAASGDVYVADSGNNRVQYFSSTGAYKGQWGTSGTGNGQFDHPIGVALAASGDVYVSDYNNRVQYFSSTGAYKGKWGTSGTGNGQFNTPSDLAVAPDGFVYVVDDYNSRIQYFGLQGAYRGQWGSEGGANGQFDHPIGMALAPNGDVYVADTMNYRIQYFTGQTSIQHNAGGVTFSRWVTGYNTAYSGGGYLYSPWAGSALEVRFIGTEIKWYGPKQPSYGMANVYMDGQLRTTIDCYASEANKRPDGLLGTWVAATDGMHTLSIVPTGTKNPASTGTAVVVDRFDIDGTNPRAYSKRYDEASGTFSGSWVKGYNSAYIGGAYRYSKYPSTSFTKTFNGTRVAWIGPKTNNYGRAKVYIDGILKGTVSQYGATGWRYRVWESGSLPAGNHTIRIVPTGTKDTASKSTIVVIDAIDVRP